MEEPPMASTKLYVGNLFYELSQRDVEEEFGKFGPIEQCAVKKGYAFVHYEQLEDAEMAVQEMNDKELGGRRLRVAFAVSHGTQRRYDGPPPPTQLAPPGPPPPPPQQRQQQPLLHSPRFSVNASPNLFVANIPPHIKMSDLDEAFNQFGEVKNVKVLPQSRPDAPMSAFVDYADIESAQKAHSATIIVADNHLRTDYNFRKNKGDGPRRPSRESFDGTTSYDGEERGGRARYDSFDSQRKSQLPRFEEEFEDPGHRRHHHRHSTRHHSSRHSREEPEERGRSGSPPPRYRRHSSSSRRGEDGSRPRAYGGDRYGRPGEMDEFQPKRQPPPGFYESRSREKRVPREYGGRMDKPPQEYRRYGRPDMPSRPSRRGPRNDRSWSPPPGPRSRSRSR